MKQFLEHSKVKAVVTNSLLIIFHLFCHETFFELGDDSIHDMLIKLL